MMPTGRISPMGFGNPGVFVRRAYREGKPFQWIRESYVNPDEAGATEVHFDVDKPSYLTLGHLRMSIEDNGSGIAADDVSHFLNTFGGGGKPIGTEHDNFGVGFKSSVMPWNGDGVVVRSLCNGEISISVLVFDQSTDEIGMLHLPTADQDDVDASTEYEKTLIFDKVVDYDGGETWIWGDIDWLQSFPEWIVKAGHGTVFTLLGSAANPDTFYGDPEVAEERSGKWAYVWYADKRFWSVPKDKFKIYGTDSLDRKRVVQSLDSYFKVPGATMPKGSRGWQARHVRGLHDCIYMVPKKAGLPPDTEDMEDEATVTSSGWVKTASFDIGADNLPAKCHVYYKDLPPTIDPSGDIGWEPGRSGLITALYKNECYDTERGHRHRQFGVSYPAIYNMTWIVIEPVLAGTDEAGVYPGTSRSHLHWKGAGSRGKELPWQEWADEFLRRWEVEVPFLYEAVKNYTSAGRSGDEVSKSLLKRTADKFRNRFKPLPKPPTYKPTKNPTKTSGKLRKAGEGDTVVDIGTNPGSSGGVSGGKGKRRSSTGPNPGQLPGNNPGDKSGNKTAVPSAKGALHLVKQAQNDDDLPTPVWVDFNKIYPDLLVESGKADVGVVFAEPMGEVHCHSKHPVILEVIEYWVTEGGFGEIHRGTVTEAVQDVYGTACATAVGHIIRQKLDPDTRAIRLDSLTAKFYGLYEAHELVGQRIRGTVGHSGAKAAAAKP